VDGCYAKRTAGEKWPFCKWVGRRRYKLDYKHSRKIKTFPWSVVVLLSIKRKAGGV
jgi:hypothetical protein